MLESNLDKLGEDLGRILSRFPQERKKLMESAGEKMYQQVVENVDRSTKGKRGNLRKAVTKVIGSKGGYTAIRNNHRIAPHGYLVENGHRLVRKGKEVGWVQGKFIYANAMNELEDTLLKQAENVMEKIAGDLLD